MAVGPHSSDAAQRRLDDVQRSMSEVSEIDEVSVSGQEIVHEGNAEFVIEEVVFDDSPFVSVENEYLEFVQSTDDRVFEGFDLIYDALKTTRSNKRLEGLRSFENHFYSAPSEASMCRWKEMYEEAGLIYNGDITPEGEVFLEVDPRLESYDFNNVKFGKDSEVDVGEIYRDLRTTSDCTGGDHNGERIKAFLMYGAGLDDSEVADQLVLPYENVKQTRQNLQDLGLIAGNRRLTHDGREFYSMMRDQISRLEDITRRRLENYSGGSDEEYREVLNSLEPSGFEGNWHIARALG